MVLSQTKKYAISALLFFTLSLTVAGVTYYFVMFEGAKLEEQMEVIGKNNLMKERYNTLLAVVESHQAEYDMLNGYLLTEGKTINFLNEVETLARQMGLQYSTDALEVKPLPNPQFASIELKLRATGERAAIIKFLTILETLPYFSRINELRLESVSGGGAWSTRITLMVGLSAYDE